MHKQTTGGPASREVPDLRRPPERPLPVADGAGGENFARRSSHRQRALPKYCAQTHSSCESVKQLFLPVISRLTPEEYQRVIPSLSTQLRPKVRGKVNPSLTHLYTRCPPNRGKATKKQCHYNLGFKENGTAGCSKETSFIMRLSSVNMKYRTCRKPTLSMIPMVFSKVARELVSWRNTNMGFSRPVFNMISSRAFIRSPDL